ncbi:MAG: hypothetical protein HW390_2653 [Candidatus Brocadiaceae bacterium]|nr:hypothetical protein [Candidatus Brocadiaceae bacterium]
MTKIKYVEAMDNYILFVKLSNGKKGVFDCTRNTGN